MRVNLYVNISQILTNVPLTLLIYIYIMLCFAHQLMLSTNIALLRVLMILAYF